MTDNIEELKSQMQEFGPYRFGRLVDGQAAMYALPRELPEVLVTRTDIFVFFHACAVNEFTRPALQKFVQAADGRFVMASGQYNEPDENGQMLPFNHTMGINAAFALAHSGEEYIHDYMEYLRGVDMVYEFLQPFQIEALAQKYGSSSQFLHLLAMRIAQPSQQGFNQVMQFADLTEMKISREKLGEFLNCYFAEFNQYKLSLPQQGYATSMKVMKMFGMECSELFQGLFEQLIADAADEKVHDLTGLFYAYDVDKGNPFEAPGKLANVFEDFFPVMVEAYLFTRDYEKADSLLNAIGMDDYSDAYRSIKAYQHAIVKSLLNEETHQYEKDFKNELAKNPNFEDEWEFDTMDKWLAHAELSDEKRDFIQSLRQQIQI